MHRAFVWLALLAPLAVQTYRYRSEAVFYGEYVHWSGDLAAYLLIATVALSPLRMLLPRWQAANWLLRHRRDVGLAAFVYAAAHTVAYLENADAVSRILADSLSVDILTGWLALLVLLPLALTSNSLSVRRLGRRWKQLHRWVYAGGVLTFSHWILTAFDPMAGAIGFAAFIAVLVVGAIARTRLRRKRPGIG
ncbi:MAG: ferric reductase-like transmembrane domain-containing protein [Woeseiaceae bacterium]|nr:ferric reductase-like transmembrane domain-containing protein [Woeseiaceae bacterium]